jgi:hypothetical protein
MGWPAEEGLSPLGESADTTLAGSFPDFCQELLDIFYMYISIFGCSVHRCT